MVEFRILLPDGTIKYLEAIGHHLFSAGGELLEVMGTHIDGTERKRAEEALRESEYKLRQIIETVPGLIWSNGPDGEPTHINQRMLDFSGMRFEDFKLRGWEAFVHPADFPETAEGFLSRNSDRNFVRGRVCVCAGRTASFVGTMLVVSLCAIGRDASSSGMACLLTSMERKKAEDLLRRSEAHLAEAQRLSHTGAVAYNGTAILFASEETYRIWGFDPAQGLPSREVVFQRIHPDDRDWLNAEVRRAVGEKRRYSIAYKICTARWNGQTPRNNRPTCVLRKRETCRDFRYTDRRDGAQEGRRSAAPQRGLSGGGAETEPDRQLGMESRPGYQVLVGGMLPCSEFRSTGWFAQIRRILSADSSRRPTRFQGTNPEGYPREGRVGGGLPHRASGWARQGHSRRRSSCSEHVRPSHRICGHRDRRH